MSKELKIRFAPEIVSSYKRLSYQAWYAFAELVDNSTQAYFDNKDLLDAEYKKEGETLVVRIDYRRKTSDDDGLVEVSDNSIGMDFDDLSQAFHIGKPRKTGGRNRYGLGLKTASFWFGNEWKVTTSKLGVPKIYEARVSLTTILEDQLNIEVSEEEASSTDHFTKISITDLNRNFFGPRVGLIKSYLQSMYRRDLDKGLLKLFWKDQKLTWTGYKGQFLIDDAGHPYKREFSFDIGRKKIVGWIGVLKSGSRSKAGIALIQNDRVVQGPPDAFKPPSIFGESGGRNDLVNQRVVGELYLDDFEVSHTKDRILWEGDEEAILDEKLLDFAGDLRIVANEHRSREQGLTAADVDYAISEIGEEMNSAVFLDVAENPKMLPQKVLSKQNRFVIDRAVGSAEAREYRIGELLIKLIIDENASINDPYLVIRALASPSEVVVVVNRTHPHWDEIDGKQGVLNFLRHCVYDGVAEWKAHFKFDSIEPFTIKHIKDQLLRVPFEIDRKRPNPDSNGDDM